jgi:hypothetical protein
MKNDYFPGVLKHGATGATGATETKDPNNNADLARPNGVAQNKNERAIGATKPISAHHPVALVAQTKKEGATEGASLGARTGAASGEVLPLLPKEISDIRRTHINLREGRRESAGDGSEQTAPRESMASDLEASQVGATATLTNSQAAEVIPRTRSGPIPWHDATPDERAEIKTALFEGLPVQIYSKVLGEIVWWALDDDVARKLKGVSSWNRDTRPTEVKPSMSGRNCSL